MTPPNAMSATPPPNTMTTTTPSTPCQHNNSKNNTTSTIKSTAATKQLPSDAMATNPSPKNITTNAMTATLSPHPHAVTATPTPTNDNNSATPQKGATSPKGRQGGRNVQGKKYARTHLPCWAGFVLGLAVLSCARRDLSPRLPQMLESMSMPR
eukprot:CAMPEP_0171651962 /NCGR_PEP_ID=MMETSP0990-20121206/38662_1 /TAXON_ID=483369 /ORGANISM="non described non described, Strain CCMP2098" /LENGTH=153 /DNA_ID=CAMNT_0012231073 /DNA_START=617 /DNA_END=1078 /DNA_ORIENTATION=+